MEEEVGQLEGLGQARSESVPPNVALVRRAFDAFERRDLDVLVELTDPEVEFFAPTAVVANEGRCYRGHGGLARYLQDVERTWSCLELVPQKFREVGNHVVCLGSTRALARDGFEVDGPTAWVWEIRAGKLCYGCVYADPGESFMGLSLAPAAETAPAEPLRLPAVPPAPVA